MYSQTNVPQPESAGVGASVRGAANVSYSVMFLNAYVPINVVWCAKYSH